MNKLALFDIIIVYAVILWFLYTTEEGIYVKISIRNKITMTMLLVILILVTSIGFMTYDNTKNIILTQVRQSSYDTLNNANDYFLRKFISEMEYVVNYWAMDEEIKNYKNKPNQPKMVRTIPEHFKDIQEQWMGYIKGSPYIAWIYLGPEEDGSLFIAPLDPTMPEDYDCRKRDWYKKAIVNRDKAVWSDPYLDAGDIGGIVVTVARVVENDGSLVGVVGMDIKLQKLSDIFDDINFGDNGFLMLMNNEGEIFSHPNKEKLLTNIGDDPDLANQFTSNEGTKIFSYRGSESIVSYMDVPDTEWKLVGIMPLDLASQLAPIKDNIIKIALISVLFAFLTGSLLSGVVTKPLIQLMSTMHKISKGDLNERIEIQSKDEFVVLGEQFNEMIDTLRGLIEERNLNVLELTKMNEEILEQSLKIKSYSEEKESMNKELSNILKEIRKNYLSTVRALASAIEANDKYTWGHCERVANISLAIAKEMGLDSKELNTLEFASILHDIGKIGISSSILNKEGRLTEEEFEIVKEHPGIGYEILSDVEFLYDSRKVLLQHHERIDGKGYPQRLYGDNIVQLAKIMAIADAYDAMTSSRPYRKIPLTKEQAIEELIRGKGTQFDEGIVDYFIDLLKDPAVSL